MNINKNELKGIQDHKHLLREAGKGSVKRKVKKELFDKNWDLISWPSKKK